MKKIKTLLPVLMTAATTAATFGFVTSCARNTDMNIRMIDLSSLLTQGWERTSPIHEPQQVSDFTKWYINQVKEDKNILRDDVMVDAFGNKNLSTEGYEASGKLGIEFTNLNTISNRISFNVGFTGNLKRFYIPYIPYIFPKEGYLWGDVSARITVKNIGVQVYKTPWSQLGSQYRIECNYFKDSDSGAKKAHNKQADINKLIADNEWSVNLALTINGGFSEVESAEPTETKVYDKTLLFNSEWVYYNKDESFMQKLADFTTNPTIRNLQYMDFITKA